RMKRPQTLTNAELRQELAKYDVTVYRITQKDRVGYEQQLATLRASGPTEPIERNPGAKRVKDDLEDIVKKMKKNGLALREHQTEALKTFWEWHEKGRGGILGDEMGLGKTCTTIVHLMRLRKLGYGPFIVFCPFSVVDHWIKETERFSCGMLEPINITSNELLHGNFLNQYPTFSKNAVVIIAHVHMERLNRKLGKARLMLSGDTFDMVVIDEAQRCKNSKSILHQQVAKMSSRFLLLTGTPIQNTLAELYALLSIVDRKEFPARDEEEWAEEYNDKPEDVKEILQDYFLRRTKELVCTDLPPINQIIFYHGLNAQQAKLYLDVLHTDHTVISAVKYNSLINTLMQLRKITIHPWMLNGMEPEPFEESELMVTSSQKLTVIDRMLTYLLAQGHSVLVFSQFVMFLNILEDYLIMRGLEYSRLDGNMVMEERNENVNAFNASTTSKGPRIFLLSTRAGGLGLNLTNADTVLFCDSDWNPQVDLQAMARCHRIGQTKPVRIIRLVGRYTAEQYLQAKARVKLHLTDKIIGAEETPLSAVAMMKFVEQHAEDLKNDKQADLSDAALESVIGKTDKKGRWMPIKEEGEEGADENAHGHDDELEQVDVDDVDLKDIDVEDYKKFRGKAFRVETRDRDELELQIACSKYSGTRQTGTRVVTNLEKDRELRLQVLKEMGKQRQEKRRRRSDEDAGLETPAKRGRGRPRKEEKKEEEEEVADAAAGVLNDDGEVVQQQQAVDDKDEIVVLE
ncbi:hypothetical protein PFISCL1PPCAC_16560, partial [Pristionchus fissidentatus]